MSKLSLFIALCISYTAFSQSYQFTSFSVAEGLTDPFIYDIKQTNKGYLLVGTGEGLAKYDGKNITVYTITEGLNGNLVSCIEIDTITNTAYLGHSDGSLSSYKHGDIKKLEKDSLFTSKIQAIKIAANGKIIALSQSQGFIIYNSSGTIKTKVPLPIEDIIANDFAIFKNQIVIASSEGLIIIPLSSLESKKPEFSVINQDMSWSKLYYDNDEQQLYAASEVGIYTLLSLGDEIITREKFKTESTNCTSFYKSNNAFVISSSEGVQKYSIPYGRNYLLTDSYDVSNGLPTSYISSVFEDNFGNTWFGSYGEGLHLLVDQFFTFYRQSGDSAVNNTTCAYIGDSSKYFGVGDNIHVINTYNSPPFKVLNSTNGLPHDRFSSVIEYQGIWAGSKNNGLYYAVHENETFKKIKLSDEKLSEYIYNIKLFKEKLWVATESGVYVVNPNSHQVETSFNTSNGLRHNKVYSFLIDEDTIWMATISNYLTGISNYNIVEKKLEVGNNLLSIVGLEKDTKGNIWMATLNNGVIQLSSNNEITNYAAINGLLSDHCYAITVADDDNVWIGHRYGLTRIKSLGNISVYDINDGVKGEINLNAMHKDSLGNIWIGTSEGLIKYNPRYDIERNSLPFVDLLHLKIDDKFFKNKYNFDLSYAKHELTFFFKGISLDKSSELFFMYILEGHDDSWTKTTEGQVKFANIRNGEYRFRLKVCDGDGNCREMEESIHIYVDDPFWMKWWFITIVGVVAIALVILIIRIRTNNLRKAQKELERQLALRTKQIVEQKEIIEEKNKDITDSINYAKRIQTTMLPELEELRSVVDGVFVYYRPRDIVSGDFYWYKQYEDRLIFVVADCTGHGVPGAFMSLIGGVALKHICGDNNSLSAQKIMTNLNTEVADILKQKELEDIDFTAIRDGMDILIAEYKLSTKELSVASAKRPYFVKQNNELLRFNGDRISIGGSDINKEFTQTTFKISEGDAIYMFSDGYTDQFGGSDYKKIQLKGVFDLLQDNLDLNPSDMHNLIATYFENWIGEEDQIDDVLFMGIHF